MIIDCGRCVMQHTVACDDCVVTALIGALDRPVELDDEESAALQALAEVGLVAPLRLVERSVNRESAAG